MHAHPSLTPRFGAFCLLASLLALLSPCASGAVLTFGTSAPSGGAASISNWTGATFDADNIGGSGVNADGTPNNGSTNNGLTYLGSDKPAQGQTFTTGSNAGGYTLSAITVRVVGYTNNIATGSNIGGYDLNTTTSTFRLRVGRISGTTFIPYSLEYAVSGGTGNPGAGSSANGPGTYLTFTLKAPIILQPNTVYGFDLGSSFDYFEMFGIRDATTGGNPYTAGTAYTSGGNGWGGGTITTQTGDRVFLIDLATYTPPAAGTFAHPGLLNTAADFERMRTNVALGQEPWIANFNSLIGNWMGSHAGDWPSHAQATITRGATNNTSILYNDIAVAYGSALRWKITGDTNYADQAVTLLNGWAYTFQNVTGDTNVLLTELYAYQFAAAAEIMQTYPAWQAADIAQFKTMIYNIFYPLAHTFLTNHNGTSNDHYWANWDLCALNSMYAIGVLCDNTTLTTEALNYFYGGLGNGCIERTVNFIHPGYLGQGQEIGRDQGHATLNVAELATLCQMAWNQGVDLFGYQNNRVLSLAEYTAKYNLMEDVPFTPYAEEDWLMTGPSSQARPSTNRPGWATLYHHYVNLMGLAAPYTKTLADSAIYWSWNGDSPGWDGLTAALPPIATGANPSALSIAANGNQPQLSWWGSAYATSYNVKRATTSGGSYTTIATGVTTNTYIDTTPVAGVTNYYVVTATTPTGETGNSNEASALIGTSLLARLKLDETSGTSAADSTGNGWTGTLVNTPTWTTGTLGNAVNLVKTSSQYLSLSSGVASTLSDFSISAWVYQNTASNSARIFDFGTGTGMYGGTDPWNNQIWLSERYMYLAPQNGSGKLRFAMTRSTPVGEETVDGASALPVGQWTHVIVTKSGSTATLYVNGQLVGQNPSMPMSPYQLPPTPLNYIGKSQWNDPYFDGKIDDFRIYRGALTTADAQTLATYGTMHLKFDEASGTTAADSTANGWTGTLVNGATWTTGQVGGAVNLASASSQYVTLPTGVVNGLTTCTLTSWVYLNSTSNWARIFDFGTGTNNYMFLAPQNGATGRIRFAIRTPATAEQIIDGTATLPISGWHHVAVTLNGATGTLYVDGAQVGQNTAMTLNPSSLGSTTQNRLGRSQFADPYLNGRLDDFHIYGTVLTAAQIGTIYSGLTAPTVTVTAGDSQNTLNWTAVSNATSYIIKRSLSPGGPYTLVATGVTGTSYTDTGLTNGVTYYYTVIAQSSLAQSAGSTQTSGIPVTPAPAGLVVTGWNTETYLSWTPVSGASSYNIKRSTTSGGPYTTVAPGVTTASYSDTGLTNGTPYYYVVSAIKGAESVNSAQATATPTSNPAAAFWTQQDIGSVVLSGNASYSAGVYSVTGAGADIWGTSDAFHYVWQNFDGDGAIIARVASQSTTDASAKAGVMIRDTLAANSAYAGVFITPSNGVVFQSRATAGGTSTTAITAGPVAPYWVKLARVGTTFTAYTSADGATWTALGSQTLTLGTSIYVGLAVCSHTTATLGSVTFDNVGIVPTAAWSTTDIGTVNLVGASFYDTPVATVIGAGADIWGTADAFRFTYLPASGDCDITARVSAIDNTNTAAKACVMIRETTGAGSAHAMAMVTPGSGMALQYRTSTGGASSSSTLLSGTAPYWVRVTRVGNVFTAYRSTDGTTWATMSSATITMGTNVLIGLAVTSHTTSVLCTATLDNLTVNP